MRFDNFTRFNAQKKNPKMTYSKYRTKGKVIMAELSENTWSGDKKNI